ncbi:MAG: carbohydrate ABC transporter permease [Acetatifactor sp.]|nr:carbohydrate ABC transporter permease [Acetatifactor sp.]
MKKEGKKIKLSKEEFIYQVVISTVLVIVLICCVIPFLYVVGMSFTSEGEMIERNYFVIIPKKPILAAYSYLFTSTGFLAGLRVTFVRTVLGVVAALILSVPLGYTLAQENLPFKKSSMLFFIITMILSGGLIPSYMLMNKLHLLNTFWVYIVPGCANTYGILVVKLFVEGIPNDIMESADLDGASEIQKMIRIAIPLLKPTICALGLFAAVIHWNDWFTTMVYVRDAKYYPAQFIVRNLLTQSTSGEMMSNISTYARMTSKSMKMASVVVGVVPILCVYPFLQKYFISGMYTGSVKG